MPVQCWLLLAAALALLCAQRSLRRALALALKGRTLHWRLRLAGDGSMRARLCRLRLYGVGDGCDAAQTVACLEGLLEGKRVSWRVLCVDRDGTLAVLLRIDRRNVAVELLARGLVGVCGTGARRYRAAQAQASVARMGIWRHAGGEAVKSQDDPRRFAAPFPWWQG